MAPLPAFLPPILNLNGNWIDVLENLYAIFKRDFIDNTVFFRRLRIIYDSRKIYCDKEEGFWHLITEDDKRGGRIPDYLRAKKLPWAKPVIENDTFPELKVWDFLEGSGRVRTYLWLENLDYALILEKQTGNRSHLIVLVTGFHVQDWKKRDLLRRYEGRIK